MDGPNILVTGGAGFIGSNVSSMIAGSNDAVALNDGYLGDQRNPGDKVTFLEQNVLNADLPTDVDVVVHLAAQSWYAMHEGKHGSRCAKTSKGSSALLSRHDTTAVTPLSTPQHPRFTAHRPTLSPRR
ncbi:NAD dependent epimerase/dehydratase family protein [Halovenus aranensis]|uniref:NAD dependent epimerase/dehydratase family protein n=1 Tax=Halovenus aranensis TaxID=890420 RepID=A0A1G8YV42_9EURY|nr:NAD dependent epimerase/dehydratase family protein [Halovenus aranensis]